jgi:hypothetical protein
MRSGSVALCARLSPLVTMALTRDTWNTPDLSDLEHPRELPPDESLVFVSHAASDGETVRWILDPVAKVNCLQLHIANRLMKRVVAEQYRRQILVNLARCGWFVIALSPRCEESEWVRFEVGWALANRSEERTVVAVLEDCDIHRVHALLPKLRVIDCRSFLQPDMFATRWRTWLARRKLQGVLRNYSGLIPR